MAKQDTKCPEYIRGKNLKMRFKLTTDAYDQQFIQQRGLCDICSQPETAIDTKGKLKWLCVDHSHSTGELRGLLCNSCNTALGKFGDSKEVLLSAIKYLEERGSYGE